MGLILLVPRKLEVVSKNSSLCDVNFNAIKEIGALSNDMTFSIFVQKSDSKTFRVRRVSRATISALFGEKGMLLQ
jgi:hypothetical protein